MTQLSSISELLQQSGAQFRIFDMGRRISKLTTDQFDKFEQGLIPYPTPYLHHAWLALMLWNPKHKQQNVVWFLKFPLDEQGFLVQAVRDDFLGRLMQNIQQMLDNNAISEANDALKDNPFSFTPDQEKMAMFHAIAAHITQQPASQFLAGAKAYFSGDLGWDQWSGVGYQGIADLVADLESQQHYLLNAIPNIPSEPLVALATCLEHSKPDHKIAEALLARLKKAIAEPEQASLVAALLRGLSNTHSDTLRSEALQLTFNSQYQGSAEVMAAIATRCNESLQHPELLHLFLERLAVSEAGQAGFSRILADLMFIPVMRILVLQQFRNENRSEALSKAVGAMFGKKFS